jgi:hypothetical protein
MSGQAKERRMSANELVHKSESFLSKRRLGWAGIAAFVGCGAWCALPLLVAAFGSGAAVTVTRFLTPGSELVALVVAFAVALGVMVIRARTKRDQRCGPSCNPLGSASRNVNTSGGLPPSETFFSRRARPGANIACTADLKLAEIQIDGYRAVFAHLVSAARFAGGFRWRFQADLGIASQLIGLAAREADCCQFFGYEVRRDGEHIVWEVTANDRAASILEEYFKLPERLRQEPESGHEVVALKRLAEAAGLVFANDTVARARETR